MDNILSATMVVFRETDTVTRVTRRMRDNRKRSAEVARFGRVVGTISLPKLAVDCIAAGHNPRACAVGAHIHMKPKQAVAS